MAAPARALDHLRGPLSSPYVLILGCSGIAARERHPVTWGLSWAQCGHRPRFGRRSNTPCHIRKGSTITTKVKSELAAEHLTSLGRIHVDTDMNGVVWLTGSARSQDAIDKAVSIARSTEHVKSVHSDLVVKQDD